MARDLRTATRHLWQVSLKGIRWWEPPLMILLALFSLHFIELSVQWQQEKAPTAEYYEVLQLAVPDFYIGDDPIITFERVVRKPFKGYFIAELQYNGTLQPVRGCVGSGFVNYSPEKKLPEGGPRLSWFLWLEPGQCQPPAGAYRLNACWEVYRERASTRRVCANSRLFNVFEKGEELK